MAEGRARGMRGGGRMREMTNLHYYLIQPLRYAPYHKQCHNNMSDRVLIFSEEVK